MPSPTEPAASEPSDEPVTAPEAPRAGRTRRGPHLFEIVALLFVAAVVLLLRGSGLRLGWDAVRYTVPEVAPGLLRALLLGVPLHLGWRLVRREPLRPYLRGLLRPAWLLLTLRIWVSLCAVAFGYVWLKVSIPLLNWRTWDQELWDLDAALHLGVSPSLFTVALFEGSPLVGPLDVWYHLWLQTALLGLGFFACFLEPGVRRAYVTSHALTWALGCFVYLSLPALGPVYVDQAAFSEVREDLPRAVATQDALWLNYRKVLAGRQGALPSLNPSRGVAAFPSLHVGIHWLLLLWTWRRARRLLVPAAVAVTLTFIGSVLTGWHYAVDGWAGIVLASACFAAAVLAERRAPDAGTDAPAVPS